MTTPAVSSRPTMISLLQYTVFGAAILYFGRSIFIPISFAILISFVLYPICAWLERKVKSRLTAVIFGIVLLVVVGFLFVTFFGWQVFKFFQEWPVLKGKLAEFAEDIAIFTANTLGISREEQGLWMSNVSDQLGDNFFMLMKNTISISMSSLVMLILIPVYTVLILLYRHHWVKLLYRIFPNENRDEIMRILVLTIDNYYNFIKGMGIVYLVVGILNSLGLWLLGIAHPLLFGFTASILTFIPYVGIMVGSLLPITLAWATYDSVWYPVGIIGVFAFVQYLEANVIFPFAVSGRLKVNTMTILLSIFAGGLLWGLPGMILFVPFAGILKLIADRHPRLSILAMTFGLPDAPDTEKSQAGG